MRTKRPAPSELHTSTASGRNTAVGTDRRSVGIAGEAEAAAFLEAAGFRILERNARADRVEIDLIARRGGLVVFVEVKTRTSNRAGTGDEAVDARKRARLVRGAQAWLRSHPRAARRVRFDVITCTPGVHAWRVRHWPGAFDASEQA